MSSYFDTKSREVSEASKVYSRDPEFVLAVADIEAELINDVTLAVGDRQFPADLREKAMSLIANWHVGTHASLLPRDEAVQYLVTVRTSELVDRMHSLFHEVASRRVFTRFGMLTDHPQDIWHRRDEHDSDRQGPASCDRCGAMLTGARPEDGLCPGCRATATGGAA